MPTTLGTIRRRILTPSLHSVSFAGRGFAPGPADLESSERIRRLEAIPQSVVVGFEWGSEARDLWELERRLAMVEPELRGFAYEGAAMAYTVRDAMAGGRGTRTRELLLGSGAPHLFLAYIGIGFAMARLPRPLWRSVLPDLAGNPHHPQMSWLAVDGYGFDRAYFDTDRYVGEQWRPAPYPWLGRALWFIHGGRPEDVRCAVDRFAANRRPDLWSGVGLAVTFAGGCDGAGLDQVRRDAGDWAAHAAQGAVFAARARVAAGHVPDHTAHALTRLTGLSVADAVALADDVVFGHPMPDEGGWPLYEVWREAIRRRVAPTAAG